MKYDFRLLVWEKMGLWAEALPDDIDFIRYWTFVLRSKTKYLIEYDTFSEINASWWTYWKHLFEAECPTAIVARPNLFTVIERGWYARFTHSLVCALRMSSAEIIDFYGEEVMTQLMSHWLDYHTCGVDCGIDDFIRRYGKPPQVAEITRLHL